MFKHVTTLTDFILQEHHKNSSIDDDLVVLITQLSNVAQIIESHVRQSGLIDIMGITGSKNASDEAVQKLDEYSNTILVKTLLDSGKVFAIGSEELEKEVYGAKDGSYIVYVDPLDGSSNIDTNLPVGTIFSIYHKSGGLLQPGKNQIAAGYILYSSSTIFVLTLGNGVYGFTYDPAIGSFALSHPNMTIPRESSIYSVNEANLHLFPVQVQDYLDEIKKTEGMKARYVGALVADMHRTLLKGGVFLYPQDANHPHGKLRLLYEVNPFAFLVQQAGGMSMSKKIDPLTIIPTDIHQRVPIIMGSMMNMEKLVAFL